MKRLFFVAALCGAVMLGGCMETTYQNKKTNNNSTTTTTTTTTTDENGNTTTTTTTTTDDGSNKQKNAKNFHSPNGKFSMDFPHAPDGPIVSEETNKAGMVQVVRYMDQVSNSGMYVALYKDYPKGVITDANVEEKLKGEASDFLKNMGAKAGSTSDERLGGNKGLSFTGSVNDSLKINMRSYFVGKRYYLIGTIATNSAISEKDSKKFINSFELDQ